MNIFITGSRGFIGSHLREFLIKKYPNYKIFAPKSSELDLCDEKKVDEYIFKNSINFIIHLANKGGDRASFDIKNIAQYNLRIFFNIVKHEKNVDKIISFGSGAEYSKNRAIINAKEEDYLLMQPMDEYGFYKSITSKYIERSKNIIQLRIFGAYGEYENYRYRFISNSIVKNLLKMPIVINKNVYFDYIYIDDLIKMIDWAMHHDTKEKIYNASSGVGIDLISLANLINENSDFVSKIEVLNDGLGNEYTSNNQRIIKELGEFKFISHKEAISKMREYFKKNLNFLDKDCIKNDPYLKEINKIWSINDAS